jgi:nitroreductase
MLAAYVIAHFVTDIIEAGCLRLVIKVITVPLQTLVPVVLVFCAHPKLSAARYGSRGEQLYCIQDATIACSYAQLAVTALGLASVWIGAVMEPEMIRDLFPLEQEQWPVVMLPIGYAAEKPEPTPRRSLSDLVRRVHS